MGEGGLGVKGVISVYLFMGKAEKATKLLLLDQTRTRVA
jgi:hypothetical protein